jgi:hypothetical protein
MDKFVGSSEKVSRRQYDYEARLNGKMDDSNYSTNSFICLKQHPLGWFRIYVKYLIPHQTYMIPTDSMNRMVVHQSLKLPSM